MASTQAHGPVQVISEGEDGKLRFNSEAAQRVLQQKDMADLPIMVVSVAGPTRTGKSFLLTYFLRHLELQHNSGQPNGKVPSKGFSWAGGADRHTTGIWFWSKIFKVQTATGPVGILLMDTQGTFDSETTYQENVTVFALSTLISSVQIYNVCGNLKEDDLEHLRMFTEYGTMASKESSHKPFQTLMFLLRDWFKQAQYPHGFEGGQQYLSKLLSEKGKPQEGQKLRQSLRASFDELSCFLMPFPGEAIASCQHAVELKDEDIPETFLRRIQELCSRLFKPENLTLKTSFGERVTVSDLVENLSMYASSEIFKGDLSAQSFYQATSSSCLFKLKQSCCREYIAKMDKFVKTQPNLELGELKEKHEMVKEIVKESFDSANKIGDKDLCERFRMELELDLNQIVATYEIKVYLRLINKLEQQKEELASQKKLTVEMEQKLNSEIGKLKQLYQEAKKNAGSWYNKIVDVVGVIIEGAGKAIEELGTVVVHEVVNKFAGKLGL